ncbi:MAG: glycosyltransferase [Bacteroidales bacterium]|jgi:rhamnosyltransferase|nr:glycosyltransferase [Bacteroidales bacterium]
MPQIDILLATYNGEKYLDQQIESIVKQTFCDWNLIIHDDGSNDRTVEIIYKWKAIDGRIKFIEDDVVSGSAAANFMHLLKFSQSPFVMFCDQDDVWLEDKIQKMYDVICEKDNTKPQVVYANAYIWNANGTITGTIPFWKPKRLQDTLFLNGGIHGCVSLFNHRLLELMLVQSKNQAMHDHILILLGLCFGQITYMNEILVKFRRHQTAVTNGTEQRKGRLASLLNKSNLSVIDKKHYEAVRIFYENKTNVFTDNQKHLIEVYLKMPSLNLIGKLFFVIKYAFTLGGSRLELIMKILSRKYINR